MTRIGLIGSVLIVLATSFLSPSAEHVDRLPLTLRSRVQPFKAVDQWEEITLRQEFSAKETALLICDMWDNHWCQAAAKRCDALAKQMDPILKAARAKGVI